MFRDNENDNDDDDDNDNENNDMTEESFLQSKGIRPTAVRILVWHEASKQSETFSLNDMEAWMPHMDRSSIFRTLRLFVEHHLLHEINDGSGHQKYCVCRCNDSSHSGHVHFTCTRCGQTFCLEDYNIPHIDLPSTFKIEDMEYIIKGICPKCNTCN